MTIVVLLALRRSANAEGIPPIQLVLPGIATLALGHSFLEAALDERPMGFSARARAALSFLPPALRFPDLYTVEVTERDPPRFAAPIGRMTYASFNLLPRRLSDGRSLSFLYATEDVPAMRRTGALIGLRFTVDF